MALSSGSMLGELLGQHRPQAVDARRLARQYRGMWMQRFLAPCVVSHWAGALGHHRPLAETTIKLLKTNEVFIKALFNLFHKPTELKECV